MKIFYICDVNMNEEGAAKVHILEIIHNLSKLGDEITLFAPKVRQYNKNGDISIKFSPFIDKYMFQSLSYNFFLFFILIYWILIEKPNAIYVRQSSTLFAHILISKIFRIPLISEINGVIEEQLSFDNSPKIFIKWSNLIERICYSTSRLIITSSIELKEYIHYKYKVNKRKIVYLENGVNTDIFNIKDKDEVRKRLNLDKNYFYLGYSGGLQKWQGVNYILESLSHVIKKKPNCKLIIIGDGPEKENLDKLIKHLKLEDHIYFKGYTLHEEIPFYINSFDISICYLTKINEGKYGTPFKVYEYLSCGSPTILSKINGITKLFRKNVIIAKPEDSIDLANKILMLLEDKRLKENLSKKSRKFILNGHSWKNVSEKTQKYIENAISDNNLNLK